MIKVPQYVIEEFKKAFISQPTKMILFKSVDEGSDGVVYPFEGIEPDKLTYFALYCDVGLASDRLCTAGILA